MRTHTIRSGGLRLSVQDQGTGFPFLMVHGMWCDRHAFDDVATGLAGRYRTVCPELRGHGRSATSTRAWRVTDLARDLLTVMDDLALPEAVVVGHSLGGMAALHMALMAPDRLRGLVLLSTSADAETPERRSQLRLLALSIRMSGMQPWMIRRAANTFFSPAYAQKAPEKVRCWRVGVRSMTRRALLQAVSAVRTRPSVLAQLDTIAVPALVMCSREDPIADPDRSAAMAQRLPHARFRRLPGGGHALPMEHAPELTRTLCQFARERLALKPHDKRSS